MRRVRAWTSMLSTGATHFGTPMADGAGGVSSTMMLVRLEPMMARVPASVARHNTPVHHSPKKIVAR